MRRVPVLKTTPEGRTDRRRTIHEVEPEKWLSHATSIQFQQWDTPGKIHDHFWTLVYLADQKDHSGLYGGSPDETSDPEANGLYEQVIAIIITGQIWGFCEAGSDGSPATVHYWKSPECTDEKFFIFAVHESSHGVIDPLIEAFGGKPDAELLAEVVSAVAARARRFVYGGVEDGREEARQFEGQTIGAEQPTPRKENETHGT